LIIAGAKISNNLLSSGLNMSYERKSELQQFVFLKAINFENKKSRFRIPEVNLLLDITKTNTGI
jgi:hypothetical protein